MNLNFNLNIYLNIMGFTGVVLCIILIIVVIQLTYSYLSLSKLSCPDCPECPTFDERSDIPSSQSISTYIYNKFIITLDDDVNSTNYLKFNVLFANNYTVDFQAESESLISKIRDEFENNKSNFTVDNLVYIQSTDETARNKLISDFNLPSYPTPLVKYNESNLYFGYVQNEWKILIDVTKI